MIRTMAKWRCRRGAGGRQGFTLAEVMVAAAILAGAVVAAPHLCAGRSRGILFRESVVAATGLAQDRTERLLQQGFADMHGGSDAIGRFRRSWSISNDATVAWLSVTVAWDAAGGERRVDARYARAQ